MTVSKASGSNSTAYTTASSSKRLSGLISGLDTDSIVAQLTSGTQSKIDKQMQSKQLAQWQQSSYREVVKALSEFKTKYFDSATSSSSILNTAFFNSNTIKNTSPLVNVSGSAAAAQNMAITKITSLAKQASFSSTYNVSNQAITTGSLDMTTLPDQLSGTTLTFSLNGIPASVQFKAADEKDQYSDLTHLATYIQDQLTSAYGANKVQVGISNGGLKFTTGSDSTSVLTLSSSDKTGILGSDGALKVYAGSSNRVNLNMSLADLASNSSMYLNSGSSNPLGTLDADGNYKISVNGQSFTFSKTDTINTVIKTINNNSAANVNITYSSTTDTFSVTAKGGGASSKIEIADVDTSQYGNLVQKLFGGNVTSSSVGYKAGQDAEIEVSFGGQISQKITRSDNSFTLDGVNFELLAEDPTGSVTTTNPIKFTTQNNTDDLQKKIEDFVTDYNNIVTLAYGKVIESKKTDGETYAPLTDAQKKEMSETQITAWETKAKKGILQNDSLLYSLTNNMRSAMTDQVASMKSALYELGITTKSDDYSTTNGQLTIDEDKLKTALTNDPDKVAALFTSSDGIATKLQKVIDTNINKSSADPGLLIMKAGYDGSTVDNSLIAKNVSDYDDQIKALKTRLENQQEYYYNQFTRLEQYMSQMNSQSSYFTSNSSGS